MSFTHKPKTGQKSKKKPPPRPPPPNFSKYKSKSTYNLNENLIEWSPPTSPKTERNHNFGGSVSSSFSSSTSSLASSKKSFECDISVSNSIWPININATSVRANSYISNVPSNHISKPRSNNLPPINMPSNQSNSKQKMTQVNVPSVFGPTIIRPRPPKTKIQDPVDDSISLPMPSVPPPSPPKNIENEEIPYAIALYDFDAREPNDLSFQVNDVILLIRKVNNEWFFGKTQEREGIFPSSFVEVIVPLPDTDNLVMVLYDFPAQMEGDLALKAGQSVKVIRKINNDWLYGESNGRRGQFPSNFVGSIPNL